LLPAGKVREALTARIALAVVDEIERPRHVNEQFTAGY
jgi:putative NADH-flavin reductase